MESHFGQKRSSFSRTVENFLGRSRIFWDGRDFSRTVEIFLGRSRFFSDDREFSRTVEILNFSRSVETFPRTLQLFLQSDYVAEKLRISGTVDENSRPSEKILARPRKFSIVRENSRPSEKILDRPRKFSTVRENSRPSEKNSTAFVQNGFP